MNIDLRGLGPESQVTAGRQEKKAVQCHSSAPQVTLIKAMMKSHYDTQLSHYQTKKSKCNSSALPFLGLTLPHRYGDRFILQKGNGGLGCAFQARVPSSLRF